MIGKLPKSLSLSDFGNCRTVAVTTIAGTERAQGGPINRVGKKMTTQEVIYLQKKTYLSSCASAMGMAFVLWCGAAAAAGEAPAKTTPADQRLQEEVTDALESDRYFYSAHVNVSVRNGVIVLHGFVFSDWDLRDAIRIATRAGAGNRVVDDLAIELGGRR
jgi:hypothetical protein